MTRLIGRRAEMAEVKRLISASRLVTLVGTGGVGKTRLALHVARQVRGVFDGGVWLVSLADLADPELLAATVMSVMRSGGRVGTGTAELVEHIADQHVLLVLDNCEHLVDACAQFVGELLGRCRNVRILATSRESLRVAGEALFPVPPLSVPTSDATVDTRELGRYDAVTLFLDRASALNPGMSLSDDEHYAVATLCRRLDGLPLAIELAAVRSRVLSVKALLSREENRFQLLTKGSRTAPARHQTLRATVDYSYEFCSPAARKLWARMSVFAGGADMDAIKAVCTGNGLTTDDVHNALAELIDKSIVTFDGSRYHMLETIRGYGRERLREFGEERDTRLAHRDFIAGLAAEVAASWFGPDQQALLWETLTEQANIRAALDFCLHEPGMVRVGLRIARSLWAFWFGCGRHDEGRLWLDRLLAADPEPSPERVSALWVYAHLAITDGAAPLGLELLDECLKLAHQLGDRASIVRAIRIRGLAETFLGQVEKGIASIEEGIEERIGLERELPRVNPFLAAALLNLGLARLCARQLDRAVEALEESRRLCADAGEQMEQAWCLLFLGLAAVLDGRLSDAVELIKDGLRRKHALEDLHGIHAGIGFLAWAALEEGKNERAARLMGASRAVSAVQGAHMAGIRPLLRWDADYEAKAREILGESVFDALFDEGHGLDFDQAVKYALELRDEPDSSARVEEYLPLTPREREIAQLVTEGKTNKDIAAQLVIARRTVDTHVEHILAKLGFTSRTQVAALFASKN
ncbi:ATP-binding protein [Saccharothrix sp. ALI-22-I]|uniref:ATP-binding protein n=1 Tax=Saccharothrix sp. ALI-22-I TaxID=1933778 RepID=UPI001930ED40|nr:LuxR C-terminal-related transcriptional regulator [Saccharothrix sp. ALI-22-I]